MRAGPSLPRFAGEGRLAPSPAKRGRVGEGAPRPHASQILHRKNRVLALDRAGPDLTTKKLVEALETINNYRDIFNGPTQSYGPQKRLGSTEPAVFQVQKGRRVRITDFIKYE